MGKYLDELKKEYGVTGKSSSKSNGKQNNSSASSNKSNEKQNNRSTSSSNTKSKSSKLEALKKEYGVTGKYSKSKTNGNLQFPNNKFNSQAVSNLKTMSEKKENESVTTKPSTVTPTAPKKNTGGEFLERLESQHTDLPKLSTTAFNPQAVENLKALSYHPTVSINSPDFASATESAFRTARGKANYDTKIPSDFTSEEIESRLDEINSELSELSKVRNGLSRASIYGNVGEQIKQNEERQAELKKEKRELERIGTFTAQEMVQWEIDDKKAEQRALGSLTPNTRSSITPAEAELYQEKTKKYYGLEHEIESLEREKNLYDYIDKYDHEVENDDFFGQWSANYGVSDISREADKAANAYANYPTEKNKEIFYAYDAFAKSYMKNNENALDDENVEWGWLSKSLAGYLPQFEDQIIPEVIGGGIGYAVGSAVGAPNVGSGLGAGIATFYPNYEVMRGSVYRTLIAEGVDEETALQAANDEALISSLIESGETAASWALSGSGKAWGAIKGAATKSVAKGSTNVATKYLAGLATKSTTKATTKAATAAARPLWKKALSTAGNLAVQGATEYGEEFLQQGVSIANRERALATVTEELGQYGNGNIDLYNRPTYKNADGTISTVDSVTYEVDGKYVLLPSIVKDEKGKAKRLTTDDEIFAHYEETGEYLGEFDSLEEANAYANKLHTAQAYYYSDKYVDPDDGLVESSADIVSSAVTGKNPEALSQMHEAGTEGFKIGVMMGGSHLAVNNTIVRFANADSITKQNEIADTIIKDPELLDEVIEAGKTSGGSVSEKVAGEIEKTKNNGKKVTRDQIRRLLESTEVYKRAEVQKEGTTSAEKTSRSVTAGSGITITPALRTVETKSINGEPITVEEAQQASGYGEKGATILALTATYTKGKSFSQVKGEMHNAYYAGLSNKEMSFETPLEQEAYMAGREDRLTNDFKLKEEAKNVVIHKNSGFYAENLPSDVTQSEVETLDLLAKSFGVKSTTSEGLKGNAVLDKDTGEVLIDLDFEREFDLPDGTTQKVSIVFYGAHEMAMHRVVELAPEEGSAFVYAMYDYLAGDESSLPYTLADERRDAYAIQGENISLATAMEEISADNILRLYNNDETKFRKAIERIVNGKNQQAKQGLMKYIDFLKKMIRKILNFISGKSGKEKAKYQTGLDDLTRLRDMFETAVAKAVENKNNAKTTTPVKKASTEATESTAKRERRSSNKETPSAEENATEGEIEGTRVVRETDYRVDTKTGTVTKANDGKSFSLKSPEETKAVNSLGEGAETVTNKNGEMLIATNKDKSTVMYSLKTYQNGGKKALEKALRENGHTEAEIKETLSYVDDAADYLTILAAGYAKSHNYTALSNHLIADVITNVKTGKQVISSIVNNGEYPINIDLALICKKRVAYMNLMNRLIDDGIFDKVNYGGEAIAKVNDLLRTDGFETACLGCFVESRRLQFQAWAETIVQEWNAEVDKRTSNAGNFSFADGKANLTDAEMDALAEELKNAGKKNAQGNLNLGQGSVQTKMGRLLDKVPSLQKHLTVADLLKPEGLTALRAYDSNLFSIVKSRYGAASPKIVQDYNPYASEIALMTFSSVKNITSNAVKGADAYRRKMTNEMGGKPVKQKGETDKAFKERKAEFNAKVEDEAIRRYLYDIGGARIQSFSDFMIENVFDYIQIFADLSAKRLPLHGYTKEIIALRLFGMTGAKWNGSWIAHVDRNMGKEYAGLLPASEAKNGNAILVHTKDGDYAIGFDDYARYKATDKKTYIQSIGMKDMIALQLDPRYSPYVGSITIGVSDKQILAMLDSPLFRFVIPYHSSGMLPQFAKLVGVDLYNDYTDYQNTTVNKWYDAYGTPCEPIKNAKGETLKVDTSYNFNAEVQKTGDAKKAADNYLKWCAEKHPVYDGKQRVGYVTFNPKFSDSPFGTDFTKHENYYKMLEDFNVYDNITEESAVQGAVTMTFPSESNRLTATEMEGYKARLRETGIFSEKEIEKYSTIADKTFKDLIADEVKGRAEYQQAQNPKWENTVKNVEQMLLADHKREMHSLKGTHMVVNKETGTIARSKELSKYIEGGVKPTEIYDEQLEKYGIIPSGEKPHREIFVPQKTAKDKKVSQTVRTVLEAKVTPDEALPTIEKMVEDGIFSYDVYTDKQAIKDSTDYLEEYGWVESLNDWLKDVNKGVVSKQHTAMGWALYNNAVNTASTTTSETERKSAMETALTVLDGMIRHQRSAAQALQATRILKTLSPETQLYSVQKSVSALQKELTDKYGKKAPDLKINEELAQQFLEAKTDEARIDAEIEIYHDIGRQLPSTFMDRWNAWRYLAMLGNVRTHIRNIFGNAFFAPVVGVKNVVATGIESIVAPIARWSGKEMLRGKSIVWGSKTDRALLKAAWSDYANVADIVSNGGKYNDSANPNQYIEKGRKIFKSKLLAPVEAARKGNSWLLEKEDRWFSQPHYAYALAQYCKANNITAEQIKNGKAIAPAREYAIKEAQKATYKDTNAFSQFVSEIGRSNTKKNWVTKAGSTVIEGVLPFRKTPANILARGVEYSPIGLLKGITYDLVQIKRGEMTATEAIDHISAGLTGTGLLALGVYLAAQGLVRGHGEDEEKEKEFKEMMGHQAYSLELPNGQSITLDWLAPEALPFFVGVNLYEQTKGADEDMNMATILGSVTQISEPMLDMSCLQGVNDLIEGVGYASSNDTSGIMAVLSSATTSYLMQGIPTLFGQAERTGEEERMTTYTEKNDFLTGDMQYTLGKASAKIPFWDYNQIPYIDAWGRKEASGTALKRGLNNFLNPAYTSTIDTSKVETELLRLYEQTGEAGVFPTRADKYFMIDGERKDLTADEYVRYATLKGENSYKAVSSLVNSKAYKKLTDAEKAEAVAEAYNYANQKAKKAISIKYKTDNWVSTADEFGSNVGGFFAFRTEVSSTKDEKGDDFSKQDVVDIILDMAQNDSEVWQMYLSEYDAKKDVAIQNAGIGGKDYMTVIQNVDKYDKPNKNGNLGTYTNDEIATAISKTDGLSKQERAILWQELTGSSSTKNNPWRRYLP